MSTTKDSALDRGKDALTPLVGVACRQLRSNPALMTVDDDLADGIDPELYVFLQVDTFLGTLEAELEQIARDESSSNGLEIGVKITPKWNRAYVAVSRK